MPDPFEPDNSLDLAADAGTEVVANVTKYLSTLPQPIEIIEEHVAVCAVIASLLKTLDSAIDQFDSTAQICHKTSFINPLCSDISVVLNKFTRKVAEAQRFKVFEPNDVGLVRVPRNAWVFIMGSEAKAGQLRSRLYVEKYRIRVLIDAVTWFGLKDLGSLRRTVKQENDFETLKKMLPLVAERLVGIWRDYQPRLENGGRDLGIMKAPLLQSPNIKVQERFCHVAAISDKQMVSNGCPSMNEKVALHSSPSSASLASYCSRASSLTITDDCINERWILRRSEARRALTSRTYVLGVPFQSTYNHTPAHYYVQPLSSHASEIQCLLLSQSTPVTQAILGLPDDGQREIQSLLESRQKASSSESVLRSWEVIAFQVRPRRKIAPISGNKNRWQFGPKSPGPLEWVFVIKGETVDRKTRSTPIRSEDPWNPKPKNAIGHALPAPAPAMLNSYVQAQQQQQMLMASRLAMASAPGAHVLRHVEQKRGISLEEAEDRMTEILGNLFKFGNQNGEKNVATDDERNKLSKADSATYTSDP